MQRQLMGIGINFKSRIQLVIKMGFGGMYPNYWKSQHGHVWWYHIGECLREASLEGLKSATHKIAYTC